MADIYMNLTFDEYKFMEAQMKAFPETSHGKGTDYYHHSVRIVVGSITFEFHGPVVKARQMYSDVDQMFPPFNVPPTKRGRKVQDAFNEELERREPRE